MGVADETKLIRCWVQDECTIFVPKDSSVRFQERDSWCKPAAPAGFSYFVWLLAEAAPANLFLQVLGTGFNRQCLLGFFSRVGVFSRAQVISCLFAVKGVTWGLLRELDLRHTSEHNLEGPGAIWGYRQLMHPHDNEAPTLPKGFFTTHGTSGTPGSPYQLCGFSAIQLKAQWKKVELER